MRSRFRLAALTVVALTVGAMLGTTAAHARESAAGAAISNCDADSDWMIVSELRSRAKILNERVTALFEEVDSLHSRYLSASAHYMALPMASRTAELETHLNLLYAEERSAQRILIATARKRDEAVALIESNCKKMQDSRDSIIGHMR